MKKFTFNSLSVLVVSLMCFVTACSKQGSVDTTPLEKSFASADTSVKSAVDKAVSEVKSANYSGAMAELQSLAGKAKLTPDQQQAIKGVMTQVEQALANASRQAMDSAKKGASDLEKSLTR